MALLDVSELMVDPDFADNLTVTRNVEVINAKGRNVITQPIVTAFVGVVQAPDTDDLEIEPDVLRDKGNIRVYTQFRLRGTTDSTAPDIVQWQDKDYEVVSVADYSNYGVGFVVADCNLMELEGPLSVPLGTPASSVIPSPPSLPSLQSGAAPIQFFPSDGPGYVIPVAPYPLTPVAVYYQLVSPSPGSVTLDVQWLPQGDPARAVTLSGLAGVVVNSAVRQVLQVPPASQTQIAAGDSLVFAPSAVSDTNVEVLVTVEFNH